MTRSKADKSKEKDDTCIHTQNSFAVLDPNAGSQEVDLDEDQPCRTCAKYVTKETDGLQCDRCKGWVHPEKDCSDLTKAQFKFMKSCKNVAIQFICLVCRDIDNAEASPRDAVARDAIAHNSAKIDRVDESINQLKKQNKEILDYMKLKSKTDDSVKLQITEAVKNEKEKEERKFNLILFNIPEPDPKASSAQAEIEDLKNIKNVFGYVCPSVDTSSLTSKAVTRCGNKRVPNDQFPDPKPRPIRVVLQSPLEPIMIRKNAKKLKDNEGLKHVGISEDKTYQERMEDRELRAELMRRRDNDEDVVIYNKEFRLRSELPNYRKNTVGAAGGPRVAAVGAGAGGNPEGN